MPATIQYLSSYVFSYFITKLLGTYISSHYSLKQLSYFRWCISIIVISTSFYLCRYNSYIPMGLTIGLIHGLRSIKH
jgi:hypothetical protein